MESNVIGDQDVVYKWERLMSVGDQSLRPLSGHTATYSPLFKKIYLFGGYDGKQVFNDMWIFDIESEHLLRVLKPEERIEEAKEGLHEWTPFPKARFSHAACLDD